MRVGLRTTVAIVALGFAALTGASRADETMIKGEITKVDPGTGRLTIKHEPIKEFDMGAMTMVWKAADPAMLNQLTPGDKVLFHPDKVDGQFTVTKIEKAK